MYALATETYSVLRGSGTNAWGDDTDASTVVLSGVPMALQPSSRGRTSRADGMLREVDTFVGWAPYGTDLRIDDRLLGERSGCTYVLAQVSQGTNAWTQPDIRLEARRVGSASTTLTGTVSTAPAELATLTAAFRQLYTNGVGRVSIVVIGDSNAEGQGAVVEEKRWVRVLQDTLRAVRDIPGPAVPFLPPAYGGSAVVPNPSVIDTSNSGATTTLDTRYGLGGRSRQYAKGAFSTWTAEGTSFRVRYAKDSFGVNANVTIDGVAQTAFSCNGGASGGFVAAYGPFAEGVHTVKVQCSDLTLGFIVTIEGLEVFQGDESYGLAVYDASRFGTVTDSFGAEHAKAVAACNPTALVFAQGINDTLIYTAAQSASKLTTLMSTMSTAASATAPSKILVIHPGRNATTLEPYANYVTAWKAAAASAGARVIDLANLFLPAGAPSSAYAFSDTVHYSQAGHHMIGEWVAADVLTGV